MRREARVMLAALRLPLCQASTEQYPFRTGSNAHHYETKNPRVIKGRSLIFIDCFSIEASVTGLKQPDRSKRP
jgi:hypothetical protein